MIDFCGFFLDFFKGAFLTFAKIGKNSKWPWTKSIFTPLAFEKTLPNRSSESGSSINDWISRLRKRTPYSGLNPFSVMKTFAFLVTVRLKPILLKLSLRSTNYKSVIFRTFCLVNGWYTIVSSKRFKNSGLNTLLTFSRILFFIEL